MVTRGDLMKSLLGWMEWSILIEQVDLVVNEQKHFMKQIDAICERVQKALALEFRTGNRLVTWV